MTTEDAKPIEDLGYCYNESLERLRAVAGQLKGTFNGQELERVITNLETNTL